MSEDRAKVRFWIIQLLRLTGVALIAIGLLVVNRRFDLPQVAGYILLVAGLVDLFFVPQVLARRWRSAKP